MVINFFHVSRPSCVPNVQSLFPHVEVVYRPQTGNNVIVKLSMSLVRFQGSARGTKNIQDALHFLLPLVSPAAITLVMSLQII